MIQEIRGSVDISQIPRKPWWKAERVYERRTALLSFDFPGLRLHLGVKKGMREFGYGSEAFFGTNARHFGFGPFLLIGWWSR